VLSAAHSGRRTGITQHGPMDVPKRRTAMYLSSHVLHRPTYVYRERQGVSNSRDGVADSAVAVFYSSWCRFSSPSWCLFLFLLWALALSQSFSSVSGRTIGLALTARQMTGIGVHTEFRADCECGQRMWHRGDGRKVTALTTVAVTGLSSSDS
jgi:hypothetical protein